MRKRIPYLAAGLATALTLAACGGGGGGTGTTTSDNVLRIAMGSPGEAQIAVWEEIGAAFEAAHEGVTVEFNFQDDDQYQTIGLPNLLASRNAPDIYFEWAGNRMELRTTDGFAADLSEYVQSGPLAGLFDDEVWDSVSVDGKIVMIPHIADVTNVLWYNKEIFAEHSIAVPTTWDEMLAACDTLSAAGIIPIASGNKDLWPMGNTAAHIVSRVVGPDLYDSALTIETSFDTPEWVAAFDRVTELADRKCINDSVNAIDDNEGAQLFFQGKAAMHSIGSWLVSWAISEAPDLEFDFFNLPALPGGEGAQNSVIAVVTGYMVNAKSAMIDTAAEFLAFLNNEENVEKFIAAEAVPMTNSAQASSNIDERTARLMALIEEADLIIAPPDVGYDLAVADAFNSAAASVIGKQQDAATAMTDLAQRISEH